MRKSLAKYVLSSSFAMKYFLMDPEIITTLGILWSCFRAEPSRGRFGTNASPTTRSSPTPSGRARELRRSGRLPSMPVARALVSFGCRLHPGTLAGPAMRGVASADPNLWLQR